MHQIHVPVDVFSRTLGGVRRHHAQCACGHVGPGVESGGTTDARIALVTEHDLTEPENCALCGHEPALPPRDAPEHTRYPWVRYLVEEVDGAWRYVCLDRGACRQRLLDPAPWIGSGGTEFDVMLAVDDPPATFEVSLNVSGGALADTGVSISEAIAHFRLAQSHAPRFWHDIATTDRHALTALATSVSLLHDAAGEARRHVILAARQAGATWEALGLAHGFDDGQEFHKWYRRELADRYDWPPAVCEDDALLGPDDDQA